MTAPQFGTDTEVMRSTSAAVGAVTDGIQTRVARLRTELEQLAGLWVGTSSTAFAQTMAEWDRQARNFSVALREMSDQIGLSSQGAQTTDEDGARTFGPGTTPITQALG